MNVTLEKLIAQVSRSTTVHESCALYIRGVPALIRTEVDKALAGGLSAEQLAGFTALADAMEAKAAEAAQAIVDNTPAA